MIVSLLLMAIDGFDRLAKLRGFERIKTKVIESIRYTLAAYIIDPITGFVPGFF